MILEEGPGREQRKSGEVVREVRRRHRTLWAANITTDASRTSWPKLGSKSRIRVSDTQRGHWDQCHPKPPVRWKCCSSTPSPPISWAPCMWNAPSTITKEMWLWGRETFAMIEALRELKFQFCPSLPCWTFLWRRHNAWLCRILVEYYHASTLWDGELARLDTCSGTKRGRARHWPV